MKSNYNDLIDIILTLTSDEDILNNIVIGGSIVPFLSVCKEPIHSISDFYVLVNEDKIKMVRNKIKKLSKTYLFDIILDSDELANNDYGFEINYEDNIVGFFPYEFKNDSLIIKTFSYIRKQRKIDLKTKMITNVSKNMLIKTIDFNDGGLNVLTPEFILTEKELRFSDASNYEDETIKILNSITDDEMVQLMKQRFEKSEIKIVSKDAKRKNYYLIIVLLLIIIILSLIAYICFKK